MVVSQSVSAISWSMISFTTVYTDRWSSCCVSMLRNSAHVCGVSGSLTHITKIEIRAIIAPMATFATWWTYYCVFRWSSRLCSRTCAWWCSRVRFWCLALPFNEYWTFTSFSRCSGGSIVGSIELWEILVILGHILMMIMSLTSLNVLIVNWGSLWWSSSLWCMCRCCRGWSLWHTVCWAWRMILCMHFLLMSRFIEDGNSLTAFLWRWLLLLVWLCRHVAYLWWYESPLNSLKGSAGSAGSAGSLHWTWLD